MRHLKPAVFAAAFGVSESLAQNTNASVAQCLQRPEFAWMYNSLSQDPCTVASYLAGACNNGQFSIPPLNETEEYTGPTQLGATPCRCNTVYFSLLSACALCQLAQVVSWTGYDGNCTEVYASVFPEPIPPNTSVPHWAYLDVKEYNGFNLSVAEALGDTPESTHSPATSASASGTSQVPSTSTSTYGADQTPSTSPHTSSDVGPIAGGVVGGVALVALVGGIIGIILSRRRRRKLYPLPTQSDSPDGQPGQTFSEDSIPVGYQSYLAPSPQQRPLLYDPSDPRTFPTTTFPSPNAASFSGPTGGTYYPGVAEVTA